MSEKDINGNNYNAHPETARNKWFNYSDPYYLKKNGENQQIADYQKQFAESVNNADNIKNSATDKKNDNDNGSFQALPETEQFDETASPVFINREIVSSKDLHQNLDEPYKTPSEEAPDNGSVKEFFNSKNIPSTDTFYEVENDGRYE